MYGHKTKTSNKITKSITEIQLIYNISILSLNSGKGIMNIWMKVVIKIMSIFSENIRNSMVS